MLSSNIPPCCRHISLPYIMGLGLGLGLIRQRIWTTGLHASHWYHCHYCNVDFVSFHNITCYTNSLLSCIHVNTANLLNITYTLIVTGVTLRMLECRWEMEHVLRWAKVSSATWMHGKPGLGFQFACYLARTTPYMDLHCAITFNYKSSLLPTKVILVAWTL